MNFYAIAKIENLKIYSSDDKKTNGFRFVK